MIRNLPWTPGAISWLNGASPAAVAGEWMCEPYTSTPDGYIQTLSSTGIPTVFSGGSIARQSTVFDVYVPVTRSWYGQVTNYINNQPPVVNYTGSVNLNFPVNVPISNIDFRLFAVDPEGDSFTVTTASSLPTGLSLVSGVIQGTPITVGTFPVTFIATDVLGEASPFPVITFGITNPITVPGVVGDTAAAAELTIHALGLTSSRTFQETVPPPNPGIVLDQSPPAGSATTPGANVNIVVSILPAPTPTDNSFFVGRVIFNSTTSGAQNMLTFDFLSNLQAGETVDSALITAEVYSGTDPDAGSIIIGDPSISGSRVNQIVEGGVTGVIYELTCLVNTSLGQELRSAAFYAVQTDLP